MASKLSQAVMAALTKASKGSKENELATIMLSKNLLGDIQVTKAPRPVTKAPSLPLPTKPTKYDNYVDVGDTDVEKYSRLEKAVQATENVDSAVSNTGAVAGVVVRAAPAMAALAPKVSPLLTSATPALNTARVVSARLAPVQAALWGADAGRALVDPAYREKAQKATTELLEDPNSSQLSKQAKVFMNTMARPVSTVGALMRTFTEAIDKGKAEELRSKKLDDEFENLKKRIELKRSHDTPKDPQPVFEKAMNKPKSRVNEAGNYTEPAMRKALFKKIKAASAGGDAGEWSARKAQILAKEYKAKGGGYTS